MESELRSWLSLQCRTLVGAEAALAVVGAGLRAPGARRAAWPADAPPDARLVATVEAARQKGAPLAQAPSVDGGRACVAVPLLCEGRVAGAAGVTLSRVGPEELKRVVEVLGLSARGLEPWLRAERGREAQATLLALAGALLDHRHTAEGAHALAAELARRAGCERVAVGLVRRGRMAVVALSTSLRFREESDTVRDLRDAMEEAVEQDARIALPPGPDAPPCTRQAHERLRDASGAALVCSAPLPFRGETVGAVTCEWARVPEGDPVARLEEAAALCGPILERMERADAGPGERVRALASEALERRLGPDRSLTRAVVAGAAALLVLLTILPAGYRVGARATLEGRVQRALVAGVEGYLAEANARAGDVVRLGDVLARLDDRDLRLARRQRESEKAALEKEYREALAARDRSQVAILRAQIEQADAKLALVEEQLARTAVVAPFDGVVLEGDLDQSLGSPVELGTVLYEIAPLDGYRVVLEVDGRDVADVAPGQRGRLALEALPGRTLPLSVERITPVSTTEDGRHYFRVEAALDEPLEALRPGMEGVAKVEVGRRRLLWIWTHGLLDWVRLRLWSWLP